MKKTVRVLAIMLLGVMLTGVGSRLISCKNDSYVYPDRVAQTDQGFRYIVSEDVNETTAIILDMDDTEKKEELVIPEKLGGYRVKQIGYYESYFQLTGAEQSWGISADRYSRIILNYPVGVLQCGINNFKGIIIVNNSMIRVDNDGVERIYMISLYGDYSNIVFNPQGGTLTTYEMIVCYVGTIPKPADPVKEGATFAGWYKDEELTEEWDFENDIVHGSGFGRSVIRLYAKWSEK